MVDVPALPAHGENTRFLDRLDELQESIDHQLDEVAHPSWPRPSAERQKQAEPTKALAQPRATGWLATTSCTRQMAADDALQMDLADDQSLVKVVCGPSEAEYRTLMKVERWNNPKLWQENLRVFLTAHEGFRPLAYTDTRGFRTVGVGINMNSNPALFKKLAESIQAGLVPWAPQQKSILTLDSAGFADKFYFAVYNRRLALNHEQINWLLNAAIIEAKKYCRTRIANFDAQPYVVQAILLDLVFNIGGPRFGAWKQLRAAVIARDYKKAAQALEQSLWYKQTLLGRTPEQERKEPTKRGPVAVALMLAQVKNPK